MAAAKMPKLYARKSPMWRVALFIESSRAYGRSLLLGIRQYLREAPSWAMDYQECRLGEFSPRWLARRPCAGVIARIAGRDMASAIARTGLPAVDVFGQIPGFRIPVVRPDDAAVARLAAAHLFERGFRHFGFCGYANAHYSDNRLEEFAATVRAAGHTCASHASPVPRFQAEPPGEPHAFSWEQHGVNDERSLGEWLRRLPKPAGVMACNAIRGQQVLNACRSAGLLVPEEVAVIGVDDDENLCELCDPPLSSIVLDGRRAGYHAAELLSRLLAGEPPPPAPCLIAPLGITARQSTDTTAIADPHIATAARFIREHACEGIHIGDVLKVVPLSRSVLHRRFAGLVGRSPKAEMLRLRLDRAKRLLAETDLALYTIATKTAFNSPEHFSVLFKAKTGLPPGEFRRRARLGRGQPT